MEKSTDEKRSTVIENAPANNKGNKKRCFVIMPISDTDGYPSGHFGRVYEYLIKPACQLAGFEAIRADQTPKTDFIVLEIIRQIVECDMAICDLSSRNANVFYELGLRQAFDLKTVLIKDEQTPRPFDISGLRTLEYKSSLRVDEVGVTVEELSKTIVSTYEQKEKDGNSLIQLLAVMTPAKIPDDIQLGSDTSIILNEIRNLHSEIVQIQQNGGSMEASAPIVVLPNGQITKNGNKLYTKKDKPQNEELGVLVKEGDTYWDVVTKDGSIVQLSKDSELWKTVTVLPYNIA